MIVALGPVYPAQIAVPSAGEAEPSTGATTADPIVQFDSVDHDVAVQPLLPPVRRACTIKLPEAEDVTMADPLE